MRKQTRKLLSVGLLIPVAFLVVLFTLSYLHVRREQRNDALIAAVKRQDVREVTQLLEEGADPNTKHSSYENPTTLLGWLKAGFHGQERSGNGYMEIALTLAVDNGDIPTVKTLLEHGADVNARREDGFTSLMIASDIRNSEAVNRLLLSAHADVNAHTTDGTTALWENCLIGGAKDVQLLLENGANVNAQDERGTSGLMLAVSRGNFDLVPVLLDHHADVNLKDRAGHTALWFSRQEGETHNKDLTHEDWVALAEKLKKAGAK